MLLGALVQINLRQNFLSVENVETSAVTIYIVCHLIVSAVRFIAQPRTASALEHLSFHG